MYIVVGVIGIAVSALFYLYIERVLKKTVQRSSQFKGISLDSSDSDEYRYYCSHEVINDGWFHEGEAMLQIW